MPSRTHKKDYNGAEYNKTKDRPLETVLQTAQGRISNPFTHRATFPNAMIFLDPKKKKKKSTNKF